MSKFIFLTFAFLGWALYEMSGGSNFQPMSQQRAEATAEPQVIQVSTKSSDEATAQVAAAIAEDTQKEMPLVTRASFSNPNFDLRAPAEEEIAAVDPAVLESFGRVLNKPVIEDPQVIKAAVATPAPVEALPDIREVTGDRVNMRNGPGTKFPVLASLKRGEEVEVLSDPGNGWLKLRVSDSGRIGWMADFLVTDGQ
jgi:hypothetical protein